MTDAITADVLILGAGAAGLFCASVAAKRGLRVVVLEREVRPGKKILISGGGRCNFINTNVTPLDFSSANPHFCKSALARFSAEEFIALVKKHEIAFHEKHRGQLFCDGSSKEILKMLVSECEAGGVQIQCGAEVREIKRLNASQFVIPNEERDLPRTQEILRFAQDDNNFLVTTLSKTYSAKNLVVATGGLSYPSLGATDFGYKVAAQFGHDVVTLRPALTPLLWSNADARTWASLAGISCPAKISCPQKTALDDLLFTHTGLSGPVILRLSTFWREGDVLHVDFLLKTKFAETVLNAKKEGSRVLVKNILSKILPERLSEILCVKSQLNKPIIEISDKALKSFCELLRAYPFKPERLAGYDKAEVTAGGVATTQVSSQTMQSQLVPGLYFIGEVLDVTGDLGGFNFFWAWASAKAAALSLAAREQI